MKSEFRGLTAKRHNHSSLAIHPYFGKVDPAIVSAALLNLSQPGQTILDPFCGSGTVIHDAMLKKRNVVGFDSSPLACMIATSKVLGITRNEEHAVSTWASSLSEGQDILGGHAIPSADALGDIPKMPRVRSVSDWFGANTLFELARIRRSLIKFQNDESPEAGLLAGIVFSRIITQASFQKGESTYSRIDKDDTAERVRGLLLKSARAVIHSAKSFNLELAQGGLPAPHQGRLHCNGKLKKVVHGDVFAMLINCDSRESANAASNVPNFDLIITSPPYLMSWDYGLYHKFRFYWLGFDLDEYEDSEIGRHLRRRDDDVERYIADMKGVFLSIKKFANPASHAVFVNAPSVVYGKMIDTNNLLRACAESSGWRFLMSTDSVGIPGPHHGMYASLESRSAAAPGSAGKKEHVLIFTC